MITLLNVYTETWPTRWRGKRGSMRVKSKPHTPLTRLEENEGCNEEELKEEMEMAGLGATAEDDKNDNYFEDPSNIGPNLVIILNDS